MSKQTAVRLPDETYQRLKFLATKTNRTATFYIREAIEKHLENLEDYYLAKDALEKLKSGKDKIISGEEFWK